MWFYVSDSITDKNPQTFIRRNKLEKCKHLQQENLFEMFPRCYYLPY